MPTATENVARATLAGYQTTARQWLVAAWRRVPAWAVPVSGALCAAALVIARRPEALLRPQFFAEDGPIFFQQAYNLGGWQAMWTPYAGYLDMWPRLVAWVALLVPLAWAPLVFSLGAMLVQVAPVGYFLSHRCAEAVPDLRVRLMLAALWVALPDSWGLVARLYNTQWHLNLLAFLVIVVATPAKSWRGTTFDAVLVGLAALSGPATAVLVLLAPLRWWPRRQRTLRWDRSQVSLAVLGLAVVIQGTIYLLIGRQTRAQAPIGVTLGRIARIVANRVVLPALVGGRFSWLAAQFESGMLPLVAGVAVGGLIPLIVALWRGPRPLRLLIAFGCGIAMLALLFPTTDGRTPAAEWLAWPLESPRYFVLLEFAWIAAVLWLMGTPGRWLGARRRAGVALLALTVLLAIPTDWRAPGDPDLHFAAYAARFDRLPPGAAMAIPINPVGHWTMYLVKRP